MAQAVTTYADLRSAMENGETITVNAVYASSGNSSTSMIQYDNDNNVSVTEVTGNVFTTHNAYTLFVYQNSVPASKTDNGPTASTMIVSFPPNSDTFSEYDLFRIRTTNTYSISILFQNDGSLITTIMHSENYLTNNEKKIKSYQMCQIILE